MFLDKEDIEKLKELFNIIEDLTYREKDRTKYEKLSQARYLTRALQLKHNIKIKWLNVTILS